MRTCVLSLFLISATANAQPEDPTSIAAAAGPLAEVPFTTGSSLISRPSHAAIVAAARWHSDHPARLLFVEGHADPVGSYGANLALSHDRAEAVRVALIRAGADPLRIVVTAFGEIPPTGESATGRRVVVRGSIDTYEKLVRRQHETRPDEDEVEPPQPPPEPEPAPPPVQELQPQQRPLPPEEQQPPSPPGSEWWAPPPLNLKP